MGRRWEDNTAENRFELYVLRRMVISTYTGRRV
jgi:hypothetical protein